MQDAPINYALQYRRFWVFYAWAMLAALLWSYGSTLLDVWAGKASMSSFAQLVIPSLALWVLYGFVAQKRVAPRWLCLAVLGLSWLGLLLATALLGLSGARSGQFSPLLALAGVWLLLGPQMFAMHKYVDASPHIWQTQSG